MNLENKTWLNVELTIAWIVDNTSVITELEQAIAVTSIITSGNIIFPADL